MHERIRLACAIALISTAAPPKVALMRWLAIRHWHPSRGIISLALLGMCRRHSVSLLRVRALHRSMLVPGVCARI